MPNYECLKQCLPLALRGLPSNIFKVAIFLGLYLIGIELTTHYNQTATNAKLL